MSHSIKEIYGEVAGQLCRQISHDLPEYFGLTECNEQYIAEVQSRTNFAIKVDVHYVGLLSLEFPYPQNGNIYW